MAAGAVATGHGRDSCRVLNRAVPITGGGVLGRPCRSPHADLPVLASWLPRDCAGIMMWVRRTASGSAVDRVGGVGCHGSACWSRLAASRGRAGWWLCLPYREASLRAGSVLLVARWEALRCFGFGRCYIGRLDWVRVMVGAPGGCVRQVARVGR